MNEAKVVHVLQSLGPTPWFGSAWWGPPCTGEKIDPPIGEACCFCAEEVSAEDCGCMVPASKESGPTPPPDDSFTDRPLHAECWVLIAYGSVRHQRGECHGDGSCRQVEPGLTLRQHAALAAAYFLERLDQFKRTKARGLN